MANYITPLRETIRLATSNSTTSGSVKIGGFHFPNESRDTRLDAPTIQYVARRLGLGPNDLWPGFSGFGDVPWEFSEWRIIARVAGTFSGTSGRGTLSPRDASSGTIALRP
jgi:hypothetical protein